MNSLISIIAGLLLASHAFATEHLSPPSRFDAADISPANEFEGRWINDGDNANPVPAYRNGIHVQSTYDNSGYHHTFVGHYLNDHVIVGIQTRVSRANQTSTRMRLTLTFTSPDTIRVDWIALDSNSDLPKGMTGTAHIVRLAEPPAPARKDMD